MFSLVMSFHLRIYENERLEPAFLVLFIETFTRVINVMSKTWQVFVKNWRPCFFRVLGTISSGVRLHKKQ